MFASAPLEIRAKKYDNVHTAGRLDQAPAAERCFALPPDGPMEQRTLPRYFFHVVDGSVSIDADGTVLATLAEAHSQAITMAGQILRDGRGKFWNGDDWQMHVTDESKRTLFKLRFSSEDTKEPARGS